MENKHLETIKNRTAAQNGHGAPPRAHCASIMQPPTTTAQLAENGLKSVYLCHGFVSENEGFIYIKGFIGISVFNEMK